MSASPPFLLDPADRSDAPIAIDSLDATGNDSRHRSPRLWIVLSAYLGAGALMGGLLVLALGATRRDSTPNASPSAGPVTDDIVRLHARDIGESCWRGAAKVGAASVSVALGIDTEGRVHKAVASGESQAMRTCVESRIKTWEFLPQATPVELVLPVQIDTR